MSTTLTQAREAIYERFAAAWGSTTPIAFDNEAFTPPEDAPWVRLVVRHTTREQETLGGLGQRNFMSRGQCFVQCFVQPDQGTEAADALAQQARTIFEGTSFATDVRFTSVAVTEIGPDPQGWFQVNAVGVFQYDERK